MLSNGMFRYIPFDDGTVLETVDVAGIDLDIPRARLRTGAVARHALPIDRLLVGGTRTHARPVVLQQVLGAVLHARRPVRVLAVRVRLPRVRDGVVDLHRRALLGADPIVVEVLAGDAVALFRSGAASRAEEMAALARVRAEASALIALGAAVLFGEPLAVFLPLAPASRAAVLVAKRTLPFGGGEVVVVYVFRVGIGVDLLPVDRLHVAQVVVTEQSDAAAQDVSQGREFEGVHLGRGDDERELLLVVGHLEQGPSANDLQTGEYYSSEIHVRNQHVTGHFPYVLQEAQVQILILQPC